MGTLIRAANLAGVQELMTQFGGDPAALLARYHIDPALIHDPYAYVPYKSVASLLERAALECQCPDFGLRLVHWQGLDMLGPVAVVTRNAKDVEEAFRSLARYLYVHGPALKLSPTGRNAAGDYGYAYRIEEPDLVQLAQSYELSTANGVHILRFLAGPSAWPARVYFPARAAVLARHLRARLRLPGGIRVRAFRLRPARGRHATPGARHRRARARTGAALPGVLAAAGQPHHRPRR